MPDPGERGERLEHPSCDEHLSILSAAFPKRVVIPDTEHRAISVDQLSRIWTFVTENCRRWHDFFQVSPMKGQILPMEMINLYHVDAWLIRPATQAENCSMVELLAAKAQPPQWFISHWWGEAVSAFNSCVQRHAEIRQLPGTACYWVCAYANRQHALSQEVAADPRETSFFRALNLSQGVLLILDEATEFSGPATPFTRIWCAFEEFVALTPSAQGRQLLLDIAAAEDGQPQLLTDGVALADEEGARRLGAGYPAGKVRSDREKSFPLEVLRAGLTLELEKAQASMEEDRRHILNCIAGRALDLEPLATDPSYHRVNQTLRGIFAVAGWRQAVERDIVEELQLPEVLGAAQREELVLDFTGSVCLEDRCAVPLARCLGGAASALREALRRLEVSCRWCPEISHEFLITLAPALPQKLEALVLRFGFAAKKVQEEGIQALAKAIPSSLTELFLDFADGTRLGDDSLKAIAEALPPKLEQLTLGMAGWVKLSDHGLWTLQQHLPKSLISLKLDCFIMSVTAKMGNPGLASLASKIAQLDQLQHLDLSFKSLRFIGDGGLSALAAALPKGLRSLRLMLDHCTALTDAGLSALGQSLPKGLEKLQLFCNECDLGDGTLAALGGAELPCLQHLELSMTGDKFTDAGLAAMKLQDSLRLLSLSLTGAQLNGAGLKALVQQMPQEVQALHLCLSNCGILQDVALRALGDALPKLNSLTMSLDNCELLTDHGLAGLVHQLPSMETLRLYLSGCERLSDSGYAAVAEKLPQSLRFLELEPSSAFGFGGLAALRQRLLDLELVLKLDCSYTAVEDEVAADLIGSNTWSALCRWQPIVAPAVPAQRPETTDAAAAVAPAVAPAPAKPAAPLQVEALEAVKMKTMPDAKFKASVSPRADAGGGDASPAAVAAAAMPSPTASPARKLSTTSKSRLADRGASKSGPPGSPLPLCGAQVLRSSPVAKGKAKASTSSMSDLRVSGARR